TSTLPSQSCEPPTRRIDPVVQSVNNYFNIKTIFY
uniref:Uncharacterized protein n=1 Tax=Amphimedon queenslandica TaxID=400682 RepID=A0A1X7U8L4_AMPQE